jgi:proteic killer suppression protein
VKTAGAREGCIEKACGKRAEPFPFQPTKIFNIQGMIKSFADKDTEAFWFGRRSRLPAEILSRVHVRLLSLDALTHIEDLRIPAGNRLERLSGDRNGQYSIRVNDQWRLCFNWDGKDAFNVAVVDYH